MRDLSHARGVDGVNVSGGRPAVSDYADVVFFQNKNPWLNGEADGTMIGL